MWYRTLKVCTQYHAVTLLAVSDTYDFGHLHCQTLGAGSVTVWYWVDTNRVQYHGIMY